MLAALERPPRVREFSRWLGQPAGGLESEWRGDVGVVVLQAEEVGEELNKEKVLKPGANDS